jgi:signal transduction histidine kinase
MSLETELELLQFACAANRSGGWRYCLRSERVTWSTVLYDLFIVPHRAEIDLQTALRHFPTESAERLTEKIKNCIADGTPYNEVLTARDTDGRLFPARAIGFPEHDDTSEIVALRGSFQDISAEQNAINARELAENELTSVLESMPDGFFVLSEDWRFAFLNSASQAMLQRDPKDLLGKNVWKEFPEAVGTPFEEVYRDVMQSGTSRSFKAFFQPLDTWFSVTAHRTPTGLAVYFRDVTDDHRRAENDRNVERLALLGQMAGGVSHDFNNLLSVILGNIELLLSVEDKTEQQEMVNEARAAIARGKSLNDSLLAFAGRANLVSNKIDLANFIESLRPLLERTLPSRISLIFDIAPGLPSIEIDEAMAESCVLNLLINAQQAIENTGEITLAIRELQADGSSYVRLSVSDTGCGIASEIQDRVFEPFFTTRGQALGSGLGLARVKGFVDQLGGYVTLSSAAGEGTTVAMHFPTPKADNAHPGKAQTPPSKALVLDDNAAVAKVTSRMLKLAGYTTIIAHSPEEARIALGSNADIELLVSDIVMPQLSGLEFSKEARQSHPELRIILMSGYPQEDNSDAPEEVVFLNKPISRNDLQRALDSFN